MSILRVALLQMSACGRDQDAALATGEAFCRQAARMGADIALFPEMWSTGYAPFCDHPSTPDFHPDDPAYETMRRDLRETAIGLDGPFVTHFRELARKLRMAIALTILERWEPMPRNTVTLIDRHGAIALTYAKVHTCEFDIEALLTPGDVFPVATLDTAQGAARVGAMICFDREFPEAARLLMLNGAELILVPNCCPMEINRLSQLRARAYENMTAIALANYAGMGHSVVYDGVAFGNDGQSLDMTVVEAGAAEGIYLAPIDLDRLRAYRAREVHGNAFRRPRLYGRLISEDVAEPFVRKLARR